MAVRCPLLIFVQGNLYGARLLRALQMPWVAGDFIYVVSVDAELICISRQDGAVIWVSQLDRYKKEKKRKGRISWAGPVLAGDHLILVSTEGRIAKVSPLDGEIIASSRKFQTALSFRLWSLMKKFTFSPRTENWSRCADPHDAKRTQQDRRTHVAQSRIGRQAKCWQVDTV